MGVQVLLPVLAGLVLALTEGETRCLCNQTTKQFLFTCIYTQCRLLHDNTLSRKPPSIALPFIPPAKCQPVTVMRHGQARPSHVTKSIWREP
jgi:hypothetical protein